MTTTSANSFSLATAKSLSPALVVEESRRDFVTMVTGACIWLPHLGLPGGSLTTPARLLPPRPLFVAALAPVEM